MDAIGWALIGVLAIAVAALWVAIKAYIRASYLQSDLNRRVSNVEDNIDLRLFTEGKERRELEQHLVLLLDHFGLGIRRPDCRERVVKRQQTKGTKGGAK